MTVCSSPTEKLGTPDQALINLGLVGCPQIKSLMVSVWLLFSCQAKQLSHADLKIIDGVPAVSAEFDSVVGIAVNFGDQDQFVLDCSGVLVHPRIVLTAAHCVETWVELAPTVEEFRRRVRVYTGKGAPRGVVNPQWEIETLGVHPDYATKRLGRADLAYIVLKEEIKDTKPLAVVFDGPALSKNLKPGLEVTMVGFGHQTDRQDQQRYGVKIWRKSVVSRAQGGTIELTGTRDLAGKGDSGGPLLMASPREGLVVIGILSHGVQDDVGTTYALLAPSWDWIRKETKNWWR